MKEKGENEIFQARNDNNNNKEKNMREIYIIIVIFRIFSGNESANKFLYKTFTYETGRKEGIILWLTRFSLGGSKKRRESVVSQFNVARVRRKHIPSIISTRDAIW